MILNTTNDRIFFFFYYGKFQTYAKVEISKTALIVIIQLHQLSTFINSVYLSFLLPPSLKYLKINSFIHVSLYI